MTPPAPAPDPRLAAGARTAARWEVLLVFLRLGCTSFGGPVAHIACVHAQCVQRRRWVSEAGFSSLTGLCQFLPGPGSSQLGFLLGYQRAGVAGALLAWLAFTLPSATLMIVSALGCAALDPQHYRGWIQGLLVAVVAVVGQAVWTMFRRWCPDARRVLLALVVASVALVARGPVALLVALALAGLLGHWLVPDQALAPEAVLERLPSRRLTISCWLGLAIAAALLPLAGRFVAQPMVLLVGGFFTTGALVFGGGHVVLPWLHATVVDPGWVSTQRFLVGYGLAQLLPGPLFTFAGFLGASMPAVTPASAVCHGAIALCALFSPGLLIALGSLRLYQQLAVHPRMRRIISGITSGVVGLLMAAWYSPVLVSAVTNRSQAVLAIAAVTALTLGRWPSVLVVAACSLAGRLLLPLP